MKTPPVQMPDNETKSKCLQSAMFHLYDTQEFYGLLLQEISIRYSSEVPTAGIRYDKKKSVFEVALNPQFFCNLTLEQRSAVLQHEILHFTNKHLFRFTIQDSFKENMMTNIGMDLSINQFIPALPEGGADINKFKMDDGTPFPKFRSAEEYVALIKEQQKRQEGNEKTKGTVNEQLGKFVPFDEHDWEALSEEDKQKLLDEARRVVKRTIEKSSFGHTNCPSELKDLLEDLEQMVTKLDHKKILRDVIKKTVSSVERENTWKRPSKRYGIFSSGSQVGRLPNLSVFIDTSGSISITELNQFLCIMNDFLKVGAKNCSLGLWHTNLYYKKRYKLNKELEKDSLQSGGTDVQCVIDDIRKTTPNLTIVLTDLYFDEPKDIPKGAEVLWIVSKGGNKEHNFPKHHKVIFLDNLME